jgi:hypothetical protein
MTNATMTTFHTTATMHTMATMLETMPTMHATMTSKIEKTNNAAVAMANSTKKIATMSTKK